MKRKTFIQLASAAAAAPVVQPLESIAGDPPLSNWAGNLTYSTNRVSAPASIGELGSKLASTAHARILGTRHCFNTIADSRHQLISSSKLNTLLSIDESAMEVLVEGGIKYGELAPLIHAKGFAIHNLASLPHISVAGSCSTATHGSGVHNGNLSTAVNAVEIVDSNGKIHQVSRKNDGEFFNGVVVSLGALGMITKVTLAIQKSFNMRQHVFLKLPMAQLTSNFQEIMSAGYSVSLFTDWQSDSVNEVWIKSLESGDRNFSGVADFFGASAATTEMHPIAELSAVNCTPQLGVAGPWYERLPHFKMGFTPSSGKELQAEYFVSASKAVAAIAEIQKLGKKIGPHLFISEIRTIKGDDCWMSPCRGQDSVAIHFTLKQEIPEVMKLLPQIEEALDPFDPRPHWGKLFTMDPKKLQSKYEKLDDFRKLVERFDAKGKFRNEFLKKNLYA